MTYRGMFPLFSVLLALGCASGGGAGGGAGDTGRGTAVDAKVITQQELAEHPELSSVGDAVRRLRPLWRARTVYAVVLGSTVNNDGSDKVGFTAPSVAGSPALRTRRR